MFLMIGANSEIGKATASVMRDMGETVISTTRRSDEVSPDRVFLDFDRSTADFEPPPGVTAACIFVAVARLAACEADPVGSSLINCQRTIELADRLTARGIYTLFLSTDKVFDGTRPLVPADAPHAPVSAYGRQKARTERAMKERMAGGSPVGILRLAKVMSPGIALIEGWKTALSAGRQIEAFHDMAMAPTPSALVARAITALLKDRMPVIAQLTGPRDLPYTEIGRFVAGAVGADETLVRPVSALDKGMPLGATSLNTTLDSSYLADRFGIVSPDVLDVVRDLL